MHTSIQPELTDFYLSVGDNCSFAKTVSEADVYTFAGVTGDFSPNHVNAQRRHRKSGPGSPTGPCWLA